MKDFRGMKRQRNRNRKPSGNQNNPNRAYESNGPEGTKVRGNAQTIYEKYQQLARDANSSGDRVLAENHLQHAEHYFRMIRQMQPQRPVSEFVQRDPFASVWDDFDDELEIAEAGEAEGESQGSDEQPGGDEQPRYEPRNNGNRDRQNGERPNGNRDRGNGERMSGERNRDRPNGDRNYDRQNNDRQNNDRQNGERQYGERPNYDRQNNDRNNAERPSSDVDGDGNRRESRRERYERRRAQRIAEQQDANFNGGGFTDQPSPTFIASTEPLGAANGRAPSALTEAAPTSFDAPNIDQPVIREAAPARERPARRERSQAKADDVASHLPAFLSRPTPVAAEAPAPVAEAEEPAKPKRGRKRKTEESVEASEEA